MIESEIKKKTGRERVCLPRSVALGAGLPTPPSLELTRARRGSPDPAESGLTNCEW